MLKPSVDSINNTDSYGGWGDILGPRLVKAAKIEYEYPDSMTIDEILMRVSSSFMRNIILKDIWLTLHKEGRL